jgi:hypothetical protein
MKKNLPIGELSPGDEAWLAVAVAAVRERRSQQGKRFVDATARNSTGALLLRIWPDALEKSGEIRPGLWGIAGRAESVAGQIQFTAAEYSPISVELYCNLQGQEPVFPMAYTIDIETIPLPGFRDRVPVKLDRAYRLGRMDLEQQQKYVEDRAEEEQRAYRAGGLAAVSGRVLSIAVHLAALPDLMLEGPGPPGRELVFGIGPDGSEQNEAESLKQFSDLLDGFDSESDELVGHNVIGFDIPFICQRCVVHRIPVRALAGLAGGRGVFDTMQRWWLGGRNRVSLDDLAWALGLESSKTAALEGSRVFDAYEAGRLLEIREYNLNDARLARKVYERMVGVVGR